MEFGLELFSQESMDLQAQREVLGCNEFTQRYGLALTPAQAKELVAARAQALRAAGRVEFGGGVIEKLIAAFSDSPYLSMHNYAETIHALLETFYYYKSESEDALTDAQLIEEMRHYFDGNCQGCIELLESRELEQLARNIRFGNRLYEDIWEERYAYLATEEE